MLELDSKVRSSFGRHRHVGETVLLLPGQWYFGDTGATLKTLLGSCVAIAVWHPGKGIGGMCHSLLPTRHRDFHGHPDARFADEAMALMLHEIHRHHTHPHDYHAHLYGGADVIPDDAMVKFNVGERNVQKAWELLDQHGFQLQTVDVGGDDSRHVSIDLSNGRVALRRGSARRSSGRAHA